MQKPILEPGQGEENEVVLLDNLGGTTCSGDNGNTHDGNESPETFNLSLFISCFIPLNFGILWKKVIHWHK